MFRIHLTIQDNVSNSTSVTESHLHRCCEGRSLSSTRLPLSPQKLTSGGVSRCSRKVSLRKEDPPQMWTALSHGGESWNAWEGENTNRSRLHPLCLLTAGVMWPAASGTCHHDFPAMLDCTISLWAKETSLKLLLSGIIETRELKTPLHLLPMGIRTFYLCGHYST